MSVLDRLPTAVKWRCRICMHTQPVIKGEDIAMNIPTIEGHIKKHRAVVTGWKDDKTKNMQWEKFVELIGSEYQTIG